jgi:L-amino acid N-acyltransferase YncA
MRLRFARPSDAGALHAILDPLVRETHMNFADAPPPVDDLVARIAGAELHPWIVAETERVVGYCFARAWSPAPGERWSVETGLALSAEARGQQIGTRLYEVLLRTLAGQGYRNAYALVTRPNPASERLHERFGYRCFGVVERTGFKLGRWHDTSWWHKPLVAGDPPPSGLRTPREASPELAS